MMLITAILIISSLSYVILRRFSGDNLTTSCAAEHVHVPMRLPWRYIFRFTLREYN
jgi:hypothetical protein